MSIRIYFEREPSWRALNAIIADPPCCFCGYNGPHYYCAVSHREDCYWRQKARIGIVNKKERVDDLNVEEP